MHERRKDCKRLNLIYWAGCHNLLYAMDSHQKCVLMLNRYESPDGCPPAAVPLLIVTRQHVQSHRKIFSLLHIFTKPFHKLHVLMILVTKVLSSGS